LAKKNNPSYTWLPRFHGPGMSDQVDRLGTPGWAWVDPVTGQVRAAQSAPSIVLFFSLPWQQAGAPALHLLLVRLAN
jgi:hypothetical protein